MTYYCTTDEVSLRLGLDSAQRLRAQTRLTSAIRRATVYIDSIYRDYGRDTPSREIATTTLNGSVAAGATSITLTSSSSFSATGNGNIDGDTFSWTGNNTNVLSGVLGISADHATGQQSKKARWPKHYAKYALTMQQVFTCKTMRL